MCKVIFLTKQKQIIDPFFLCRHHFIDFATPHAIVECAMTKFKEVSGIGLVRPKFAPHDSGVCSCSQNLSAQPFGSCKQLFHH